MHFFFIITFIKQVTKQSEFPKFAAKSGGGSKRYKSSGSSSFNIESKEASINLNTNVGGNDEDEVQEIRRPMGRDKARDAAKKQWSRASGLSSMNEEALARLMVTEVTTQEKEQRDAFIKIKRKEVKCRERELATQEYRQRQEDIRFYLQPYDHLTGEQRMAMAFLNIRNTLGSWSRLWKITDFVVFDVLEQLPRV
ncbi:hypothetical protein Tco_1299846, partial [Tanacetum coccineum]